MANAIVMRAMYNDYGTIGPYEPIIYVDSINKDGHMAEIYNQTVRFIREHTPMINGRDVEIRREDHLVKDEKKVSQKQDGYWLIADENKRILTLYKKTTVSGYFYNYPSVQKVYEMCCRSCPKIVPNIVKKGILFDDFSMELKNKVAEFGRRTDSMKIEETDIII
jgi:hypothetical protein